MSLAFALPIGHPSTTLPSATRTSRLNELRGWLARDTTLFSADNVFASYTLSSAAQAWSRDVVTFWSGALARQQDSLVTIELPTSAARELSSRLPPRVPVPRRVTFGPIVLNGAGSGTSHVEAGQPLGTLSGNVLRLAFEDALGFWIDPAWAIAAFDAAGLWDLPTGSLNPLAGAGAGTAGQPIATAGPQLPPERNRPMLVITGGQPLLRIFNPPRSGVPPDQLYFFASDAFKIGVFSLPAGHKIAVRIEDRSTGASRAPFIVDPTLNASVDFTPQDDLRPDHPPYQPGTGGGERVIVPLRYEIRVDVQDAANATISAVLTTVIEQGHEQTLRQAFLFHGPPFQSTPALPQPLSGSIRKTPTVSGRITPAQVYSSAYFGDGTRETDFAIDSGALLAGAEFIRRAYARRLFEDGTLTATEQQHLTADVVIPRGWTDPELNEHLGGPIDDPSQWGAALDLTPFHTHMGETLFLALARAGTDFLTELRRANPSQEFTETAVRLKKNNDELWRWTVTNTGITESPGAHFSTHVTGAASAAMAARAAGTAADAAVPSPSPTHADAAVAEKRAERAAVVTVTFSPSPVSALVSAPVVQPYPVPPVAATHRCLIVLATEHPNTDPDTRIPIDVAGRTLERALRAQFPLDEIVTREVGDPIQLLTELGAFRITTTPRIRFFCVLSHAFNNGLQLLKANNVNSIPNPEVETALKEVYGRRFAIGGNDIREFKTHQFRLSNLVRLPEEIKQRLKATMKGAEVFILGCTSGARATGISHAFAQAFETPVLGAGDFSKFYKHFAGDTWRVYDDTRGSTSNATVVLLPAALGGEWVKNIAGAGTDILAVYRQQLRRFDPKSPEEVE